MTKSDATTECMCGEIPKPDECSDVGLEPIIRFPLRFSILNSIVDYFARRSLTDNSNVWRVTLGSGPDNPLCIGRFGKKKPSGKPTSAQRKRNNFKSDRPIQFYTVMTTVLVVRG